MRKAIWSFLVVLLGLVLAAPPLAAAPSFSGNSSKTWILHVDADGSGGPTPGDTIRYTISMVNFGDELGTIQVSDPIPAEASSWNIVSFANGTNSSSPNTLIVNELEVAAGGIQDIVFDVVVGLVPDETTMSNTATYSQPLEGGYGGSLTAPGVLILNSECSWGDTDGDGVLDEFEDLNGDGICGNDDSDGDGTPNYRDADDDGDGVYTINEDTDRDGDATNDDHDADGVADFLDTDSDNDGILDGVEDVNGNGFQDMAETDRADDDTDDDGLLDGTEDSNKDGTVDSSETDPLIVDTDGDGLSDGLESGLASPEGFDTAGFIPDADPTTTTDPLNTDSDGDGTSDGAEDANQNGQVDPGETDPNVFDDPTEPPPPPDTCNDDARAAIEAARAYQQATRKVRNGCTGNNVSDCSSALGAQQLTFAELQLAQDVIAISCSH